MEKVGFFDTFQQILDKDLAENNPWFARDTQKKVVRFAKTEMDPPRMPHCRSKDMNGEHFPLQLHSSSCKNYKTEKPFIFTAGIRKVTADGFYDKIQEKEKFVLDCIDTNDSSKVHVYTPRPHVSRPPPYGVITKAMLDNFMGDSHAENDSGFF